MPDGAATSSSSLALIHRAMDLLDLYHDAYAAHHGESGPNGCPLCAEFRPRIEKAMRELEQAIDVWGGC